MGFYNFMSLSGKSLREKMHVAFALMSIIPLLIMAYLVTGHIFPSESGGANFLQISVIAVLAIWVALTGLMLAKEIILPVINLSLETKIVASGEYNSDLLSNEKELGDIASAVNNMTGQMKGYVGELQQYHERTYSLNAKIHHKVLTLTNLMRLGDMISSGTRFKEIADFATIRMAEEITGGFCVLYVKENSGKYTLVSSYDKSGKFMETSNLAEELGALEKDLLKKGSIIINAGKNTLFGKNVHLKKLISANLAFVPMTVNSSIVGMVIAGNFEVKGKMPAEEVNVFKAYSKELVLAFESEKIGKKVKNVEVIDSVTGLYSFNYLEDRLEDEISRSVYYQRPCSLIVIELNEFEEFAQKYGVGRADHILKTGRRTAFENNTSCW